MPGCIATNRSLRERGFCFCYVLRLMLNQEGLKSPVIQHVCGDPSVLGGVFEVMDLLPGQPLGAQPPQIHALVLGESMARMHALIVSPPLLKRSGGPALRMNTSYSPRCLNAFLKVLKRRCPGLLS